MRFRNNLGALMILGLLCLGLTFTVACNSDSPTSSSPSSSSSTTPTATSPTASTPAPTPTPSPSSTSPIDIKIHNNGRVVNNEKDTFRACLYHKPYGEGKLLDPGGDWLVKPGSTPMTATYPGCEPTVGQLDVIDGQCPPTPHGLVPLAANPNVTIPAAEGVGEWVWGQEIRTNTEEEWSECVSRDALADLGHDLAALDLLPVDEEADLETADDVRPGCFRYRLVTMKQTATRTCDPETQTRTRSYFEYERCDCPCKVPAALETSLDHNRNDIWTEATVEGEGAWELKIFAANRPGEYPDNPDWTKRTTRLTLDCEEVPGPETMRATFRWRNHGAPYWWAALYVDGQRVWLSRRVRK